MDVFSNIRWANLGIRKEKHRLCSQGSLLKIRPDPERVETISELVEMLEKGYLQKNILIESKRYRDGFLGRVIEVLQDADHTVYLFNVQDGCYKKMADKDSALHPLDTSHDREEIDRGSLMIQTSIDGWMDMKQWDWWKETDPQKALDPFLITLLNT